MNNLVPTFDRLLPYTVGFDRLFDQFTEYTKHQLQSTSFPPYNIRREGENKFFIDLAVAGFSKEEIEIEITDGALTIRSIHENKNEMSKFLYHGISAKKFTRVFTITDDIIVKNASYVNGILTVELERVVPEAKKSKLIKID